MFRTVKIAVEMLGKSIRYGRADHAESKYSVRIGLASAAAYIRMKEQGNWVVRFLLTGGFR